MAIEKLKTLIHIYRGDYEPYSFTFLEQNNDNETTNLNLSERFDDIRLEIRTKNKYDCGINIIFPSPRSKQTYN